MQIELSDEEVVALRDLLTMSLGDLSVEIAKTENPRFRRGLRDKQRHLQRIHRVLTSQAEAV